MWTMSVLVGPAEVEMCVLVPCCESSRLVAVHCSSYVSPPSPNSPLQVKDKEGDLKSAEQKLHDEFERLRRQNAEEKRELDTQKNKLVCNGHLDRQTNTDTDRQTYKCTNIVTCLQEEEIKMFNQKKAALQAQRAQTERDQVAKSAGKKK